jgi:hypothetical protein
MPPIWARWNLRRGAGVEIRPVPELIRRALEPGGLALAAALV